MSNALYSKNSVLLYRIYLILFIIFLLSPILMMMITAFNDTNSLSVSNWYGFTFKWFYKLSHNTTALSALINSLIVAFFVAILSSVMGFGVALLLNEMQGKTKILLYAFFISPILLPGVILGISTLIIWKMIGVSGGLFLTVLAQSSFLSSYCLLLYLTRLSKLDPYTIEAAKDMGATGGQAIRYIALPFIKPAFFSATALSMLLSFENYNTSLFVVGAKQTLPIYIGSFVRVGLTPEVTALSTLLIVFAATAAFFYKSMRIKTRVW